MKNIIKKILEKEKIEYFGIIPFEKCNVINQGLLDRSIVGWTPKSVIILIVPYYSGEHEGRNISLYAIPRDYHLYFNGLYSRLEEELKGKLKCNCKGFSDHSPIGETYASAYAGLGVIGKKFQLINEKYGSHVFIGEIITDIDFECYDCYEIKSCIGCNKCIEACPSSDNCLSAITQKKGSLTDKEADLIVESGIYWGCDICRTVCPMNDKIFMTPITFFKTDLTPVISQELIEQMNENEFKDRAYSWRGKNMILRNLKLKPKIK